MPRMADGRDVRDATFACPDLTTFTRLDELGLEVIGQRLDPDCAVLARRVVDPDDSAGWCRRCGGRARAEARPAIVRSEISSRSNSARAAKIPKTSLPAAVVVSIAAP